MGILKEKRRYWEQPVIVAEGKRRFFEQKLSRIKAFAQYWRPFNPQEQQAWV
jgi:hypothetical protein